MNKGISFRIGASLVGSCLMASAAFSAALTFHPERALIGGNGCPQQSTRIYADEFGGIAIEHDAMAIMMEAYGGSSALAERKGCAIRVPVTIQRGFYVRAVEQRLSFAIRKSAGAEAKLATRTSISGIAINPFTVALPYGDEIYSDNMIDTRRDFVGGAKNRAYFCQQDASEEHVLQINLAMTGQRNGIEDELLLAAYGGYLGEGFEIELAQCP